MSYVTSWYHLDHLGVLIYLCHQLNNSNSNSHFFLRIPLIPNISVTQDQYMFSYVFYVLPQNCCAPKKRICDPKSPKTTPLPDLKVSMGAGSVPGIGSPRSSNGAPSSREPSWIHEMRVVHTHGKNIWHTQRSIDMYMCNLQYMKTWRNKCLNAVEPCSKTLETFKYTCWLIVISNHTCIGILM